MIWPRIAPVLLVAAAVVMFWPSSPHTIVLPTLKTPGVVTVTDQERAVIHVAGGSAQLLSLFNRRITPASIGRAVLVCETLHGAAPFPATARRCTGTYSITDTGSIEVSGVSALPQNYALAVVGGTGEYANVGGTLTVTLIAAHPTRELLVFNLTL